MLVDKQNELMSDLLFTVHQHGGDDVTWKPPIHKLCAGADQNYRGARPEKIANIEREWCKPRRISSDFLR